MEFQLTENKKFIQILSVTESEYEQLKFSLTKYIDGYRFHPLVRKKLWDGKISFVKGNKVPAGLWQEVIDIAKQYGFPMKMHGVTRLFDEGFDKEDFIEWQRDFFKEYSKTPRDYQIEAAVRILKYRRCLAELATSAGKSLIVFMVLAYALERMLVNRVLLIVPNVSLVIQASEDFDDYNQDKLKLKIQQIYAGQKIKKNSNIVVGTYQSLVKKDHEYFKQFDMVICDETHKANSNSIRQILDRCWHCDYRFGLSGTVPKKGSINCLTLMSNTGPLITQINANYLIKRDFISPCEVRVIEMDYASDTQKEAFSFLSKTSEDRKKLFALEQNFVASDKKRLKFVVSIISKVTKNTLVLFHRIIHGKALYDELRNLKLTEVYYVDGGVGKDLREMYKKKMEEGTGRILVASFGTFSTGINITNIHNVFLTESFKSEIVIRQSIGRGLRKNVTKKQLTIIDLVDDLRWRSSRGRQWKNYLYRHAESRLKIYEEQKFPYKITKVSF